MNRGQEGNVVTINRAYAGHRFTAAEPYEVTRGKIREFAEAIGDPNPAYRSVRAARALGHPDLVAPPTFPIVITGIGEAGSPIFDPDFGLDYRRVLHGEQKFRYRRPVHAGDLLTASGLVAEIRDAGPHELVRLETELSDARGELVCTAVNVLISRGTGAGEER
ncbi:MaoC family dehydratase N-terminal domain-containing protein [Saccharopolyspora taberi]|uniref:MaoC family dehydratase N-terminal domain-containing protein n=1 Tax=Saccharopolyspora taberi TaxID=60895 RepID=A0ABN3VDN5_9PSEU